MESLDVPAAARVLWDYLRYPMPLRKSDVILIACSHDIRVADHAAVLFHDGWAPMVLCSGGIAHRDDLLNTGWDRPEADIFAERLQELGVPEAAILREPKARNTGENLELGAAVLEADGIRVTKVLGVQKPYMERRLYATAAARSPGWELCVSSPDLSLDTYPSPEDGIHLEDVINIMVGDFQRIEEYPKRGFQISMEIPTSAREAWMELLDMGYTRHLIPGVSIPRFR